MYTPDKKDFVTSGWLATSAAVGKLWKYSWTHSCSKTNGPRRTGEFTMQDTCLGDIYLSDISAFCIIMMVLKPSKSSKLRKMLVDLALDMETVIWLTKWYWQQLTPRVTDKTSFVVFSTVRFLWLSSREIRFAVPYVLEFVQFSYSHLYLDNFGKDPPYDSRCYGVVVAGPT